MFIVWLLGWLKQPSANIEFLAIQNCFILLEILIKFSDVVNIATTHTSLQLLFNKITLTFVYLYQNVRFLIHFVELSLLETFNNKGKSDIFETDQSFQIVDGLNLFLQTFRLPEIEVNVRNQQQIKLPNLSQFEVFVKL